MTLEFQKNPSLIEDSSFRIIDEEVGEHSFSPMEYQLVRRVIHA
ncbi:MAG: precorrin-8X methylmutase, partial [Candidatus Hydrogenedentota bacterium]